MTTILRIAIGTASRQSLYASFAYRLNFSEFIEEKSEESLQDGKNEHDEDDFDHIMF